MLPYHEEIDLTQEERLEEWWGLSSDRERFVWALQTETRVRTAKVQRNNCSRSVTLQTKYLFDLYLPSPIHHGLIQYDSSPIPKRDIDLYLRKVNPAVWNHSAHGREPNGEFNALAYPLDMKPAQEMIREHLLPPNLLFFEMMLEAYCGYPLQGYFHHIDPSMPRAAIMGGAIVAVLVSWKEVRQMQEWQELKDWFRPPSETTTTSSPPTPIQLDSYDSIVERLQRKLQDYFYGSSSLFAAGDVDIFLQPSPLTRSLTDCLAQHGLEGDLWKQVTTYLGGFEMCEGDLRRFATALCGNMIVPAFEGIGPLIYSATQRGLSFALATHDEEQRWLGRERWPRNTQLIMLNEQADLVGALFDFDISVVAFAYDGNQVRAAPRAVLSLLTNVQVVTPFVLAEKRNRHRIVKYCQRGFRPYMIDPFCNHPRQCRHDCCDLVKRESPVRSGHSYFPAEAWHSRRLNPHNTRGNLEDYADQRKQVCNCAYNMEHVQEAFRWSTESKVYKYTFGVVAKTEHDLFQFLAKRNQWSLEHQKNVRSIHPMARMICRHCRDAYMLHLVLPACPPDFADSMDELLHGEMCYVRGGFYAGGTFNSTAVRSKARTASAYLSLLKVQAVAEKAKYWIRHGSCDGYKERFAFADDLKELLDEASKVIFAEPHRRPLGLNPERFMEECEKCQKQMPEREYGTRVCEECKDRLRFMQEHKSM